MISPSATRQQYRDGRLVAKLTKKIWDKKRADNFY